MPNKYLLLLNKNQAWSWPLKALASFSLSLPVGISGLYPTGQFPLQPWMWGSCSCLGRLRMEEFVLKLSVFPRQYDVTSLKYSSILALLTVEQLSLLRNSPAFIWLNIYILVMQVLEKAMATHSSTLAWKIPWMEEPDGLQSMGLQESDRTERLNSNASLASLEADLWNSS